MTVHREVILQGRDRFAAGVRSGTCGAVLMRLDDVVQRSVRMAFRGASSARGRTPAWLSAASDLRLVDFDPGERAVLHYEVPTFEEAGPELYRQGELFATQPAAEWTAIELLAAVLEHANAGVADSDRYDRALLNSIGAFRSVLDGSIADIRFADQRLASAAEARLSRTTAEQARNLSHATPGPRAARIAGRLDMLRVSTQSFAMELDDGTEVGGVLMEGDVETLRGLLNQRVLVHGKAVYRPSGSLLRLDADLVELGAGATAMWSRVPAPLDRKGARSSYRRAQTSTTGVNAIFGQWPGDETDADLLDAIDQLS